MPITAEMTSEDLSKEFLDVTVDDLNVLTDQKAEEWTQFFTVLDGANKQTLIEGEEEGASTFVSFEEGQTPPEMPGRVQRIITRRMRTVGLSIERSPFLEIYSGKMERYTKQKARMPAAERKTMQVLAASLYDYGDQPLSNVPTSNGLPTIDTRSIDGNPFLYPAHTYIAAPERTWSNIRPFVQPDEDPITDAMTEVMQWTDSQGFTLGAQVTGFITTTRWEITLRRLFLTPRRAGTNFWDTNMLNNDYGEKDVQTFTALRIPNQYFMKVMIPGAKLVGPTMRFAARMKALRGQLTLPNGFISEAWFSAYLASCSDGHGIYAFKG